MAASLAASNLQEFVEFENSPFTAEVTLETRSIRDNKKVDENATLLPSLNIGWDKTICDAPVNEMQPDVPGVDDRCR